MTFFPPIIGIIPNRCACKREFEGIAFYALVMMMKTSPCMQVSLGKHRESTPDAPASPSRCQSMSSFAVLWGGGRVRTMPAPAVRAHRPDTHRLVMVDDRVWIFRRESMCAGSREASRVDADFFATRRGFVSSVEPGDGAHQRRHSGIFRLARKLQQAAHSSPKIAIATSFSNGVIIYSLPIAAPIVERTSCLASYTSCNSSTCPIF